MNYVLCPKIGGLKFKFKWMIGNHGNRKKSKSWGQWLNSITSISAHRKWPEMVVSASTNQVWTKITFGSYAYVFCHSESDTSSVNLFVGLICIFISNFSGATKGFSWYFQDLYCYFYDPFMHILCYTKLYKLAKYFHGKFPVSKKFQYWRTNISQFSEHGLKFWKM